MKIRTILHPALIGSMVLLPAGAMAAEGVSYTFLEGDYLVQDIDLFEDDDAFDNVLEDFDDGDGFGLQGSVAFMDNLFLFGHYARTEGDFTFVDDTGVVIPQGEDIKSFRVGLGFNAPLAQSVDLVARAAYYDLDFGDFNLGSSESQVGNVNEVEDAFDDLNEDASDGYMADIGARAQLVPWLEGGAGLRYTSLEASDDFSVFGNLMFEMTENFGFNLTADFGENISTYSFGLRYSFH